MTQTCKCARCNSACQERFALDEFEKVRHTIRYLLYNVDRTMNYVEAFDLDVGISFIGVCDCASNNGAIPSRSGEG